MDIFYKRKQHHKKHYITRELGVPLEIEESIWQLHYITFGILFSIIACLTFFSILGLIRDDRQKKFQRRHYFLWMNLALFYFSLVMSIAMLGDPWERRRYIEPRSAREAVRLLVRLRLPCLAIAFSLIQVSLMNVTEVVLYATWFHNIVIICILNSIQLALVVISTVTSMFVSSSTSHVWVVCDVYMFLFFTANSFMSLYTGAKILRMYHHHENKFCKVVCSSGSWYRHTYGNPNDDVFDGKEGNGKSEINAAFANGKTSVGEDNSVFVINGGERTLSYSSENGPERSLSYSSGNGGERHHSYSSNLIKTSVSSADGSPVKEEDHPVAARVSREEGSKRHPSLYPVYVDDRKEKTKTVIQKRRIGSLPYATRTSKFCDKSIEKVSILMMVVAVFGIVMCVTIVLAIYTADIFANEQIGHWKWYALRTVRRISELGVSGTMAYMIRNKTLYCW